MADVDSDDEETKKVPEQQPGAVKEAAKEEDTSLANDAIVNKYQEAARIAQAALVEVSAKCIGKD